MKSLTESKRHDLAELCRRYNVRNLELFGSATGIGFDPNSSDLDFLVEFDSVREGQCARRYFGLLFALEDVLGRHVDLVETAAIRNPYFLE
jgi:predicted nucleotidyltransferase